MKKVMSSLIVLCMIFSLILPCYAANISYEDEDGYMVRIEDFRDTQEHWAHDQILKWADYNIISGYNGNFMPDSPIIRGDLAIIIDRMLGLKNTTYNYFSDLRSNDYYRESILKCVASGYINGVGDNMVNPKGNATREEVAVILCRIFNIDSEYTGNTGFKDDSKISSWARSSVFALSKLGYLNGTPDGNVNPKSNITRAELITLLNNFADTYISKNDIDNSGYNFVANFPKNVVVCRDIVLKNSTVARDIYLTQNTRDIELINTVVRGRLVSFASTSILVKGSSVQKILLMSERSSIEGVSEDIAEIYVCAYASESSFDDFPKKLVLEPGVRVSVDGVMYENNSTRTKTYYGIDLKADLADEQGYVVGGPRISNGSVNLDYDNNLTLSGIRVTSGNNNIREVGIVWLEADKDEDIEQNPTYKKNDGKVKYYGAYYEPFDFDVGEIKDYCVYRLYVRDNEGLYAYSSPFILEAYDFSISIKISDENYPESMQVDIIFRGDNVPNVRNVQLIYDVNALYNEKHNTMGLRKYVEEYAENPKNEKEYLRFKGIVESPTEHIEDKIVYNPPTAFGYIIEFGNGSIINRFPVISDVLPEGVLPVETLTSGTPDIQDTRILLNGCTIKTSFVKVQEVGIVYRQSSSSVKKPSESISGWNYIKGTENIDVDESFIFTSIIPIDDRTLDTYYAPYIKTDSGYFYGDMEKVNGVKNIVE